MMPFVSIVIPCYNEEKRLPTTIYDIYDRLRDTGLTYELIIVNDGSTDNTSAVVETLRTHMPFIRVLHNATNQGKGSAVRKGMLAAEGHIRLFMDADNATTINHFLPMIPFFEQGYSVVIGSRAQRESVIDPPEPWYRRLIGSGLNLLVQAMLLPRIWDTQCGFKAFTAAAANRLFSLSHTSGWGFDVEILSLARAHKYSIKEMPVHWAHAAGSNVRLSSGFEFLKDIFIVRWKLWTKQYELSHDEQAQHFITYR